jgi:hypothetical protein
MDMEFAFELTVSAALVVSAIALIRVAVDLRLLRVLLDTSALRVVIEDLPPTGGHHRTMAFASGYGIFVYRDNQWVLEADLSSPGFEPVAPTVSGSYEGQVLKKGSVPVSSA